MHTSKDIRGVAISFGLCCAFIAWTFVREQALAVQILTGVIAFLLAVAVTLLGFRLLDRRIDRSVAKTSEQQRAIDARVRERMDGMSDADCRETVARNLDMGHRLMSVDGPPLDVDLGSEAVRELLALRKAVAGCGIQIDRPSLSPLSDDHLVNALEGANLPADGAVIIGRTDDGHGHIIELVDARIAVCFDDSEEEDVESYDTLWRFLAEMIERDRIDGASS